MELCRIGPKLPCAPVALSKPLWGPAPACPAAGRRPCGACRAPGKRALGWRIASSLDTSEGPFLPQRAENARLSSLLLQCPDCDFNQAINRTEKKFELFSKNYRHYSRASIYCNHGLTEQPPAESVKPEVTLSLKSPTSLDSTKALLGTSGAFVHVERVGCHNQRVLRDVCGVRQGASAYNMWPQAACIRILHVATCNEHLRVAYQSKRAGGA